MAAATRPETKKVPGGNKRRMRADATEIVVDPATAGDLGDAPAGAGRHASGTPSWLKAVDRAALDKEFAAWMDQAKGLPGIDPGALPAFGQRMFGGDFHFAASKDILAACKAPILLMPGDDLIHLEEISVGMKRLAPHTEVVAPWKGDQHKDAAMRRAAEFFAAHQPRN